MRKSVVVLLSVYAMAQAPTFHITRNTGGGSFANVLTCKTIANSKKVEGCKIGEGYTLDDVVNSMMKLDPCEDKPPSSAVISNEGTVTGATYDNVHNYTPCGVGVQNKAPVKGVKYNNVTSGPKK